MLLVASSLGACGPSLAGPVDTGAGEGDGRGTTATGTGQGSDNGSPTTAAMTAGEGDTSADSGVGSGGAVKLDLGEGPDAFCSFPLPLVPPPTGACVPEMLPGEYLYQFCQPGESVQCEAILGGFSGTTSPCDQEGCSGVFLDAFVCGANAFMGVCCGWFVAAEGQICPGRPLTVGDGADFCLARGLARGDWRGENRTRASVPGADSKTREALARVWTQIALFEHASVASFSRFVLQLLSCGAPGRLVASATSAVADEVRHAEVGFSFASEYAGRPVGPGPLALERALDTVADFETTVLTAVREGCIAETVSGWQLQRALAGVCYPALRRELAEVADEELRHVALAWEFLAWVWPRCEPDLQDKVRRCFAHPEPWVPRGPALAPDVDDAVWRAHGILPEADRLEVAGQALASVVGGLFAQIDAARGTCDARPGL